MKYWVPTEPPTTSPLPGVIVPGQLSRKRKKFCFVMLSYLQDKISIWNCCLSLAPKEPVFSFMWWCCAGLEQVGRIGTVESWKQSYQ